MSPLFRARTVKNRYMIEPDHLPVLIWLGVSFVLALLSSAIPDLGRSMRSGVLTVLAPVIEVVEAPFKAVGGGIHTVGEWAGMKNELDELRTENERLMGWYHKAKRLEAENAQLRKSAQRVDDPVKSFVTARVVMDQEQAYLRTALIAAGRKHGVMAGQAVLAKQALAGRVLESSGNVARLLLVTDASSRIPVMIEETGQRAIMAGNNTSEPELMYVPEGEILTEGARIVTSGHGGVFPPYIPVGVVKTDEAGRYKVVLFADLDALDLVRIVNYALKIDLPVDRTERSAPAQLTNIPGSAQEFEEKEEEPAAEAAPTESNTTTDEEAPE